MESTYFYTFSTIAQTLAGAIALLAAFVLYWLQLLNAEIENNSKTLTGWVDHVIQHGPDQLAGQNAISLHRRGQYRQLLNKAKRTNIREDGWYRADIEQEMLPF